MNIAQLMTKDVRTCKPNDTLEMAARLMWDHDIGALPVVDDSGQLIGMVTDRDACMAAFMQRQPLHDIQVSVAMTKHVVACRPEDSDAEVAKRMAHNKVRRIPVVDDAQRPIGVVSLNDLALAMSRTREITAAEVARTLAAIVAPRAAPATA